MSRAIAKFPPRFSIARKILVLPSLFVLCLAVCFLSQGKAAVNDPTPRPGRQVRVAAIAIGFGGDHDAKLRLALEHLEIAGKRQVDIACLPEEFAGTAKAETLTGPTVTAVAALARKHHMYVVCPIREQADREQYNTAVLLDRQGNMAGYYRKVFVVWGEDLWPSREGVKVFQTDFGRISLLTCFDLNFPELWLEADRLGAEIVFWPSAYTGGSPLNAMAMLFHYYIIPVGAGNIMDITGRAIEKLEEPKPDQFIATIDLDRTFVHLDFNKDKVEKLLREHAGEVELESFPGSKAWYLLRSIRPGVLVRELCTRYHIETLREYQHRSRDQINEARKARKKI